MSLVTQAKILRVLQEQQFQRVGGSRTLKVNVRVIAASNKNLEKEIKAGKFREDLYYRINVVPVRVPALRERHEDIPLLVWAFVKEFGDTMGKTIEKIPTNSMAALQSYPWPGNVRELRNAIERAMILSKDSILRVELPKIGDSNSFQSLTLKEVEKNHILDVLERTRWRIRGKNGAAEFLGLKPTTLEARMKKLMIKHN